MCLAPTSVIKLRLNQSVFMSMSGWKNRSGTHRSMTHHSITPILNCSTRPRLHFNYITGSKGATINRQKTSLEWRVSSWISQPRPRCTDYHRRLFHPSLLIRITKANALRFFLVKVRLLDMLPAKMESFLCSILTLRGKRLSTCRLKSVSDSKVGFT